MRSLFADIVRTGRFTPILAAIFLLGGHPFPAGTVAFGCLFAAAVWLERTAGSRATAPA